VSECSPRSSESYFPDVRPLPRSSGAGPCAWASGTTHCPFLSLLRENCSHLHPGSPGTIYQPQMCTPVYLGPVAQGDCATLGVGVHPPTEGLRESQ